MVFPPNPLKRHPKLADLWIMNRPRNTMLAIGAAVVGVGGLAATIASCERSIELGARMRSSVEYTDLKRGNGPPIEEGRRIGIHYEAKLPDGTVFLNTRAADGPHHMIVGAGGVIIGVDEAVRGMRLGGVRRATVPPEMHWGRAGYADIVPANTPVTFVIELVSVH